MRHRDDPERDAAAEFRSIYERNALAVYRFALSLGADAAEAEDITAEAFARALTSRTPIRELTARAYVMTIARHYFLETRRRRRKETGLAISLPDDSPLPDAAVEYSSELDAVRVGMHQLSDSDRAVLLMRTVHEMPYEEIARSLGISVVAAKVKAHRARRALAALIPRPS
jgi:RNA polymerase sigma-70 factor (ECF subfamily)